MIGSLVVMISEIADAHFDLDSLWQNSLFYVLRRSNDLAPG